MVRNIENFAEYITPPFSYVTIITLFVSWFFVSFGLSFWLSKTALAKWMNPIYVETQNQQKILSLATTVEELEEQITFQTKFIATLQEIIQGKAKNELPYSMPSTATEPAAPQPQTNPSIPLSPNQHAHIDNPTPVFISPINGMITKPFHRAGKHYGIDMVAKEKDPIKAIAAGVVILSDWSVDTGWVIVIQHYNNVVSICKHCAILFKKVGNLVRAGDVIALMGNSGEISTGPHLHFELWSQGVPLNPEDYINS